MTPKRPSLIPATVAALGAVVLGLTGCAGGITERLPLPGAARSSVDDQTGELPDGGVPVDSDLPGVTRLDPELKRAVVAAATAAQRSGIELRITSGWRSVAYQQRLFDKAAAQLGPAEAAKLVASPGRSRHTVGEAVDIGPAEAAAWLIRRGSRFGLCQIYANETWHFELAPVGRCPPLKNDATEA